MAAALASGARSDRLFFGAHLLAQARQSIIFAQKSDDRMAFSPSGPNGCGQIGAAHFHLEACISQHLSCPLTGLDFVKSRFRAIPDLLGQIGEHRFILFHGLCGDCFQHYDPSLSFFQPSFRTAVHLSGPEAFPGPAAKKRGVLPTFLEDPCYFTKTMVASNCSPL